MRKLFLIIGVSLVFLFLTSFQSFAQCEGDFDCDGDVDGTDLAVFAADFGRTDCGTSDLVNRIEELEAKVAQLELLLAGITRDVNDNIIFEGVNVHIVNGSGGTSLTNGLGNLIVGYNENTVSASRIGSHNMVVGIDHEYTSYAGLLAGRQNSVRGTSSSVMGYRNEVTSNYSTVSGGYGNTVSSIYSSVSGGYGNTVRAAYASVSGANTIKPSTNMPA